MMKSLSATAALFLLATLSGHSAPETGKSEVSYTRISGPFFRPIVRDATSRQSPKVNTS